METSRAVPEYTSPEEDILASKYYASNFQFQSLLDGFDWFLEHDMDACMRARKYTLSNDRFGYLTITRLEQPSYQVDEATYDLTPEIALLEDRTYAVSVWVVAIIEDIDGNILSKSEEFNLFECPIPRYSKRCYYNWIISDDPVIAPTLGSPTMTSEGLRMRMPPSSVTMKTKAPKNPGCEFIINGTKNVVLLFEKGRFNQYSVHVDTDSVHRGLYVCLISESPHSTSSTNIYMDKTSGGYTYIGVNLPRAVQLKKDEDEESEDDEALKTSGGYEEKPSKADEGGYEQREKTSKKKDRQPSINILCVAYAILSVFSGDKVEPRSVSKRFVKLLQEIIPKEVYSKCYTVFSTTLLEYYDLTSEQILEVLYTRAEIPDRGDPESRLIDLWIYFRDQMFPNWRTGDQKFNILVMATARLLLTYVDYIKVTDRNHWATRSLHGPGPMTMGVFRRLYTRMIYTVQGESGFVSIATAEDLARYIIDAAPKLASAFIHSFKPPRSKGKGVAIKKPQGITHKAIAIDASPINVDEMRTILTKTRNSAFKESPSFNNRAVQGSYWKVLCSYYTTEDDRCGLTKFTALMTIITSGYDGDPRLVMNVLLRTEFRGRVLVSKTYKEGVYDLPITVDSLLIGFTSKKYGYGNVTLLKRYGIISRKTCIVMTRAGVLEIYTDPHRLMIPVVTCDEDSDIPRIFLDPDWKSKTFEELLDEGYIEYMDNYEIENESITLAQTYASFHNHRVELEKWQRRLQDGKLLAVRDPLWEKNVEEEIRSLIKGRPNAMALHPLGSFGVTAAKLSFQHFNMPCRNAYATKMYGQEMDTLDNPYEHVKSYTSVSRTISTVRSGLPDIMGHNPDSRGNTVAIALIADPLDQEDACIVNKRFAQLGGLRYNRTMIFRDTLDDKEHYGRLITGENSPYIMRHIGENGIPATGVRVGPRDCILGKYRTEEVDGKTIYESRNLYMDRDEEGVITEVVTFNSVRARNKAKKVTVSIKVVLYSQIQEGDKVTAGAVQKFTVSTMRNAEDMPWNENLIVDVALNPACFPTRMTTGTTLEPLIGMATALGGRLTDTSGHRDYGIDNIRQTLIKNGFDSRGTQRMNLGTTGKRITSEIFIGLQRINQLAHIAAEKIQCRSTGKQNKVNRQADASKYGETRNKGQKIGEPERNKLIQYGASFVIQDRMNLSCDGVTVVICKVCSSYASFDKLTRSFSCPKCGLATLGESDSSKYAKFIMPQTARYTHALLTSLGVVPKLKFVDRDTYLNQSATRISDLGLMGEILDGDELDTGE